MLNKRPFLIFSAKLLGSYGIWKVVYYILEIRDVPLWVAFKDWVAYKTVEAAAWIATNIFSLDITYNSRNLLMDGKSGVFVADHCLAIPAVVVFSLFIIFYAGRWRDKIWFIPLGIFSIFLINSLRVAALSYVQRYYSAMFFELAHSYVYLIITYGLIFLFIVWWVEVFAERDTGLPAISI